MTARESIIEIVNRLFIYTDEQNWEGLINEVFTRNVHLDMTSLGGEAIDTTASNICSIWNEGFKDLDAVNHLSGNYLIKIISEKEAKVFAYATATHYKSNAKNGRTREFVGTYDIKVEFTKNGWRINKLKYNLKYMTGNMTLD